MLLLVMMPLIGCDLLSAQLCSARVASYEQFCLQFRGADHVLLVHVTVQS